MMAAQRLRLVLNDLRRRFGSRRSEIPPRGKKRRSNLIKGKKENPGTKPIRAAVPQHLLRKQRPLDDRSLATVERSLRENYHTGWRSEASYSKEAYEKDLRDHLTGRLSIDRRLVVPWLDDVCSLIGQRILEIGCGTGSSTLALAEQGAKVVGIDIDAGALSLHAIDVLPSMFPRNFSLLMRIVFSIPSKIHRLIQSYSLRH